MKSDFRITRVHRAIWEVLQQRLALAVLATGFTLVMSNVGATVLLVPLAVNIAIGVGADPAVYALTVALATSNSFLIPTHQVNALIMGPPSFRVADFVRAGDGMTVLFLVVLIVMMNVVYRGGRSRPVTDALLPAGRKPENRPLSGSRG